MTDEERINEESREDAFLVYEDHTHYQEQRATPIFSYKVFLAPCDSI